MTIIYSALENNIFSGILVKKGQNTINKDDYSKLLKDKAFKGFQKKGFIKIEEQNEKTPDKEEKKGN